MHQLISQIRNERKEFYRGMCNFISENNTIVPKFYSWTFCEFITNVVQSDLIECVYVVLLYTILAECYTQTTMTAKNIKEDARALFMRKLMNFILT